ncbi:MAG: hypothetical protein GY851_36420 [bacterium]|nr:hypothetical protein [bacterium]
MFEAGVTEGTGGGSEVDHGFAALSPSDVPDVVRGMPWETVDYGELNKTVV